MNNEILLLVKLKKNLERNLLSSLKFTFSLVFITAPFCARDFCSPCCLTTRVPLATTFLHRNYNSNNVITTIKHDPNFNFNTLYYVPFSIIVVRHLISCVSFTSFTVCNCPFSGTVKDKRSNRTE